MVRRADREGHAADAVAGVPGRGQIDPARAAGRVDAQMQSGPAHPGAGGGDAACGQDGAHRAPRAGTPPGYGIAPTGARRGMGGRPADRSPRERLARPLAAGARHRRQYHRGACGCRDLRRCRGAEHLRHAGEAGRPARPALRDRLCDEPGRLQYLQRHAAQLLLDLCRGPAAGRGRGAAFPPRLPPTGGAAPRRVPGRSATRRSASRPSAAARGRRATPARCCSSPCRRWRAG